MKIGKPSSKPITAKAWDGKPATIREAGAAMMAKYITFGASRNKAGPDSVTV
jgi:hypothetical protein